MRRRLKLSTILAISFLWLISSFFLLLPDNVYAYLDPGSGSYILQLLVAALLGGLFTVKVFWIKVKKILVNLFLRVRRNNRDDNHG